MESGVQSFFTFIIVVQFIIGNLSNGFIVLINFIVWVNKRKLSSVDQILMLLAISRIGLIWEILVSWFQSAYLFPQQQQLLEFSVYSWILLNHFSLWLATVLSIFYLLKIASFSSPIFLYLKWRVKKVILIILLGSLVLLFLNGMQISIKFEDWKHGYERNTTWNFTARENIMVAKLILFNMTMFSLTPYILTLIFSLLLISSLWKHLQKMKLNSKQHRDPKTEAHINALKIVVSFLLLYTSYFLSLLVSWLSYIHNIELIQLFSATTGLIYPSSHSLVLILGNSKLRQAFLCILKVWDKR
ncbi:taste receptor type 2 member 13-like [Octodon degus]|uniref:Taste receptor type 2 n=1 Tax=Octodon degus TaxID=10160 RepID=A0A6P3EYY6_OCTDE|nr:taste receptor type 2 member 13-like [Octodon degus]